MTEKNLKEMATKLDPHSGVEPKTEGQLLEDLTRPAQQETAFATLRLLWNKRRALVRAACVGVLASTLLAFLLPKRYESVAHLMPPDERSSSGLAMIAAMAGQLGGLGSLAGDALETKTSGALFIGILRSRTVEDRLIERFNLKHVYGIRLEKDARQHLEELSIISEDKKDGIITIAVTDGDPGRAAALASAYVEELDRLVAQLSTSSAHRERVFLEERLVTVKADLDEASERFAQFASRNTAIDIQAQGKVMVDAAAQLQGEIIGAEAQLEGLKQIYADENVRVKEVQARISELRRQLEKIGGSYNPKTKGLMAADDMSYPSIRELPLLGVTYGDLFRRTKIEEAVFETLTQQFELAKVQEAKETPSVKVLDPPEIPERKSYPPRLLIMFVGTAVALGLTTFWLLGDARWAGMAPGDARKEFAIEVIQTLKAQVSSPVPNGRNSRNYRNASQHK